MVDYNAYAKTFSESRKNMKWEEIEYFLSFLWTLEDKKILDVGCGNGRLLSWVVVPKENYIGIDKSTWLLDEAKILHPWYEFHEFDMQDIWKNNLLQKERFDVIFLIASFHHLETLESRKTVLHHIYNLLKKGGCICMTNWALESPLNKKKYEKSFIDGSENQFWGKDFSIKIGDFARYYHSFTLQELEYLMKETWLNIIENRLFDTEKNSIMVAKK